MKSFIKRILSNKGYFILREDYLPKGTYWEADLKKIIKFDRFQVVMDVGAYHGWMTNDFLKNFPSAHVIVVEPAPQSFQYLRQKFQNNSRVTLQNCGAGKEDSLTNFWLFEGEQLNSFKSIKNEDEKSIDSVKVNICTIETIVKNIYSDIRPIDFLKIDVEGFEIECLKGAEQLLKNNEIGCILIEAGFNDNDERHTNFFEISKVLKEWNFSFFALYNQSHFSKNTELLFANALFLNEEYLIKRGLLKYN